MFWTTLYPLKEAWDRTAECSPRHPRWKISCRRSPKDRLANWQLTRRTPHCCTLITGHVAAYLCFIWGSVCRQAPGRKDILQICPVAAPGSTDPAKDPPEPSLTSSVPLQLPLTVNMGPLHNPTVNNLYNLSSSYIKKNFFQC